MSGLIRKYIAGLGWQTVVDTDSGGSVTPPVDLQGTDPAEAVLTLRADDAQTEHIFRAYNAAGDLAVDIDFEGKLDTSSIHVQVPPDTGGGAGTSSSHVLPQQWIINSGDDTTDAPLKIAKWDGLLGFNDRLRVDYANQILVLQPEPGEVAVLVGAPLAPSGNAIEIWDNAFDNLLFAVPQKGGVIFPSADPLVAGAWWDDAGTLTRSAG